VPSGQAFHAMFCDVTRLLVATALHGSGLESRRRAIDHPLAASGADRGSATGRIVDDSRELALLPGALRVYGDACRTRRDCGTDGSMERRWRLLVRDRRRVRPGRRLRPRSVFKADRSSRRHVRGRRHISDRSRPDRHQPGPASEILRGPHGKHVDREGCSQRHISSAGVVHAAADERFRQVRRALSVTYPTHLTYRTYGSVKATIFDPAAAPR
jgi:hypothetical protein